MTLKHILVHLDSTRQSDRRAKVALGLATRFSAHLTAVYGQAEPDAPGDMPNQREVADASAGRAVLDNFQAAAEEAGISVDTRLIPAVSYSQLVKHLSYAARDSDLSVFSQHDEEGTRGELPEDLTEQVIIRSGRPVLVVPYAGTFEHIGERAIIGWNGTRESARALNDALPFLQQARACRLLSINPPKEIMEQAHAFNEGVLKHLELHDVQADVVQDANPEVSPANLLISRAADFGADLLVMGAHGQHGWTQMFKGSVARELLKQLTVPAILSH